MRANPLSHHLFTMACNGAWANQRLLSVCARLDDEAFAAPRVGFFGSLLATANHVLTVDWFYVDAIERALDGAPPHPSPGDHFEPELPFARCAELASAQREVDLRLVDRCRALSDDALDVEVRIRRRSGDTRDPLVRVLAHLFQHSIHHRGQMHAMLSSTELAPPPLDEFFGVGEAAGRARELEALGLSEESIWGGG
ncbi:MAG: DinB family protein [Sandaracinaceae bacterium]|nr:DinB family protein [Sandaracinaceae bacterium]